MIGKLSQGSAATITASTGASVADTTDPTVCVTPEAVWSVVGIFSTINGSEEYPTCDCPQNESSNNEGNSSLIFPYDAGGAAGAKRATNALAADCTLARSASSDAFANCIAEI